MPNIILPNTGMELPDVGSDQDTWGDILNADLSILDLAVQYDVVSKTLSNADVTLTAAEAASAVINLTGTLTANVNVIVPAAPVRVYLVRNATTGPFTVNFKTVAAGVSVLQGTSALLYSDDTNIVQGANSINGSFSAGNTSVANLAYTGTLNGGTGAVNIGGTVNLGVAAASTSKLTVDATALGINVRTTAANTINRQLILGESSVSGFVSSTDSAGFMELGTSSNHLINIKTNNATRATVTATGKIVIGGGVFGAVQAVKITEFYDSTAGNTTITTYDTSGVGGGGRGSGIGFHGISNDTGPVVTNWGSIVGLKTNATQGNTQGYLAFLTNTGATSEEKARIIDSGYLKASNVSGTYGSVAGLGSLTANNSHNFQSNQNNSTVISVNGNTGSAVSLYDGNLATGSTGFYFTGKLNTVTQIDIAANGNVRNTNNSYTAISDLKNKENIIPASPKLEDILKVNFVNFNFKESTGFQTHKQFGVIAQELEQVFPGLVQTTPDLKRVESIDEHGKEVFEYVESGTFTKSVNASVLCMMSIKALQEETAERMKLEERIKVLEAKMGL